MRSSSIERQFKIVIEQSDDGYLTASVPALPGCHTQAKTLKELKKRIKEAILLCLEVAEKDPEYQRKIKEQAYEPVLVGLETISISSK